MSINSTNPSVYFGGTWERIAKGRTLVGVDEDDTDFSASSITGGEKTHTLTTTEMPSHSHKLPISGTAGSSDYLISSYTTASRVELGSTGATGGGQAHNNLQPFYTCYIWLRTA